MTTGFDAERVGAARRRIRPWVRRLLARHWKQAWLYGRWAVMWLGNPEPWHPDDCAAHAAACAVRAGHWGRRALAFRGARQPRQFSVPRSPARAPRPGDSETS